MRPEIATMSISVSKILKKAADVNLDINWASESNLNEWIKPRPWLVIQKLGLW